MGAMPRAPAAALESTWHAFAAQAARDGDALKMRQQLQSAEHNMMRHAAAQAIGYGEERALLRAQAEHHAAIESEAALSHECQVQQAAHNAVTVAQHAALTSESAAMTAALQAEAQAAHAELARIGGKDAERPRVGRR